MSGIICFPHTPDRLQTEPGIRVLHYTNNPVGLAGCTETHANRFSDRLPEALCVPGGRFVSSGHARAATGAIASAAGNDARTFGRLVSLSSHSIHKWMLADVFFPVAADDGAGRPEGRSKPPGDEFFFRKSVRSG